MFHCFHTIQEKQVNGSIATNLPVGSFYWYVEVADLLVSEVTESVPTLPVIG